MIDTLSLKRIIIDNATSGVLSSYQEGDGTVDSIISELPQPSTKRKKLLEQEFEYGDKYPIPKHWRWVRLGEISNYGDSPKKVMPSDMHDNMWILELEDIEAGGKLLSKKRFPERNPAGEKTAFVKGQVLYSKLRPYLRKVLVVDEEGVSTPELIAFDVFGGINVKYITYCLVNSYVDRIINKRSYGVKMPRVDSGFMANLPIPLPPLEEQERIVNTVEKSFEQIDIIDDLQEKYRYDLATLKSKIIDAGIRGKLTEQLSEDGDAETLYAQIQEEKARLIKEGKIKKEKPLEVITEDEIPFEIPKNWKWVRLGNICPGIKTGSLDANQKDDKGVYPFFTCGEEVYTTSDYAFDCDAILLGGNNASGDYKMHRYNGKFNAYQRVYVITGSSICLDYVFWIIKYWLPHLKTNSQGMTTRFIKIGQVTGMLVPLPPLKEQERIASKVEILLEQL